MARFLYAANCIIRAFLAMRPGRCYYFVRLVSWSVAQKSPKSRRRTIILAEKYPENSKIAFSQMDPSVTPPHFFFSRPNFAVSVLIRFTITKFHLLPVEN